MPGYLYAVIFEQGTVKVGMTGQSPEMRLGAHRRDADKYGIEVWKFLKKDFGAQHLALKENALCGYCLSILGKGSGGNEWFRFTSKEEAEEHILDAFEKLEKGELDKYFFKNYRFHFKFDEMKFNMAMDLVKSGQNVPDVARSLGLDTRSIYMRKPYKQWVAKQSEGE